jgi:hypothetical protein
MESTASPLKAAPAKLLITLFTFSLLPTSSSRIGEPKDFSQYRAEEQVPPRLGGMASGRLRSLRRANGLGNSEQSTLPPLRRLFHPASPDATFSRLCHSNRDVQYAIDAGDFAPESRHLLVRACRIGRRGDRLADATLKTFAARLDRGAANSPGESRNARLASNSRA